MPEPTPSVSETLRRLRNERALSLAEVAEQAGISVATLSRVETNKQGIEVGLLLTLARILGVSAAEIVGGEEQDAASLSRRIAQLPAAERARVFSSSTPRPRRGKELESTLNDLVATVEVLREELLGVQRALDRGRRR